MNKLIVGGILVAAACGSSENGRGSGDTCGSGTTDQNGVCVPTGSGSGTTCGTGTHLEGTACVPDGPGATAAPTITGMTPDHAGITGNVLFQIQGTGFAGQDITDMHVYFGDTTPSTQMMPNACEAVVGAATATTLAGEVPAFCFNPTTLAMQVTITTNVGMATTPFTYDAMYAADGSGGASQLWIVDPYASLFFALGTVTDAVDGFTTYSLDSIAFDSSGVLYGVTAPDATLGTHAQLVTLTVLPDAFGSIYATVVGKLFDAQNHVYTASSIKMVSGTLYAWATRSGGTTIPKYGLVSVDTTTGLVTPIGTTTFRYSGALVADATNTVYVAPDGAGADTNVTPNTSGELDTLDMTSGAVTNMTTLDYAGVPVTAMTFVGTTMVAALDYNAYAAMSGLQISGAALAIIDPTAANGQLVTPAFELPAPLYGPSHVDALDMAPSTLVLARKLDTTHWQHMGAAATIAH
jgi:hypothetical protein